jgi:hypothetical protein
MAAIVYHESQMRRGLSIFLILTFALAPLSALADGSEDANLPLCCRRHGAHHCSMNVAAMRAMMRQDGSPAFTAPITCPYYPPAATVFSTRPPALAVLTVSVQVHGSQVRVALTAPSAPISKPNRTHAGRGPPANSLS